MSLTRAALAAGFSSFLFASLVGCSDPVQGTGDGPPPYGPEGGLIEIDAAAIPQPTKHSDASAPHDASHADAGYDAGGSTKCSGVAEDCNLRGSASCSFGCTWGGSCGGYASSCYSQFDSFSCNDLEGCYWSYTSNTCSGSSYACSTFPGSASCGGQSGCSWQSACDGYPTPCDLLTADECPSQPGCHLE